MAEGGAVQVTVTGLQESLAAMKTRAERIKALNAALKVVAAEIDKRTADAFANQRSPAGQPWPPLAESTLEKRAHAVKSANRRTRGGKLTKGAASMRARITSTAKPLQDTGRLKNSAHARVTAGDTIEWSEVWYGGPHITGGVRNNHTGRPPKRNMSVFERGPGGDMQLIPDVEKRLRDTIATYVREGNV